MPTLGLLSTHKHTHTHKRIHAWRQPHHTKRVYTRTVNCTTKTKKHGFSATNVQLMLKILASAPLCSAPNILPRCKMSLRTHARRSSETGTFLLIFYNPCIYFFPIFHNPCIYFLPIYYNPCIYFLSIFYNPCTYFLSIFYTFHIFSTCIYFLYWGGWQTWDLSKSLHGRIFRPKILQTKNAYIAPISTQR